MSVTDPLADMFTIIRNGSRAGKEKVELPSSKLKLNILELLKKEGYIRNYKALDDKRQGIIRVYLKFNDQKKPAIRELKRVSKPGLRIYADSQKLPNVLRGMGTAIISTSCGVMTDGQARSQKLGGEVICYVW